MKNTNIDINCFFCVCLAYAILKQDIGSTIPSYHIRDILQGFNKLTLAASCILNSNFGQF